MKHTDFHILIDDLGKIIVVVAGIAALFPILQYYGESEQRRADSLAILVQTLELCEQVSARYKDPSALWFNAPKEDLVSSKACDELKNFATFEGGRFVAEYRKEKNAWCQATWDKLGPQVFELGGPITEHCWFSGRRGTAIMFPK
ncbi:hypothetical protein [Sedimentitalea sp.]|uniref:hypothetical protein n=1 Tax=Sedimentitalea sp. TaxID=2048915 RepID=UPI0032991E54